VVRLPVAAQGLRALNTATTTPPPSHLIHTLGEYKQCILTSIYREPDFTRGCAGKRIDTFLFATHPHPGIREWFHPSIASGNSRRSESLYSPLRQLVIGNKPRAGAMQDRGSGRPRTPLLGTSVNKPEVWFLTNLAPSPGYLLTSTENLEDRPA
jgi:hypothetical protein